MNREFIAALLALLSFSFLSLSISAKESVAGFSSTRFEESIKAFEASDRKKAPPIGGTVFVGSSTFTLWKDLEREFADLKAVNRGFGGSTLPDINEYVSRIVTKYKPKKVVLYAGTNDIAELKHDGKEILHDFQTFVKKVQTADPKTEVYFISMSMAPSRVQFRKDFDEGNKLVREFISGKARLHYIDVVPVMRDRDGNLRAELFGPDQLHMNPDGYTLWVPVLRKELSQP